ncbi:MAG: MarR family transcriptional regulator [Candidatus Acidiferrales bacterium]
MAKQTGSGMDYHAIADFRFEIRRFLHTSERLARAAGLEPQQHQALLAIKGLPPHRVATVGVLAERLLVQHHSAVELVNRLEAKGLLRRARGADDRRSVLLVLTRRGEMLLKQLALTHRAELKSARSKLLHALTRVAVRDVPSARTARTRRPASPANSRRKRQTTRKRELGRK